MQRPGQRPEPRRTPVCRAAGKPRLLHDYARVAHGLVTLPNRLTKSTASVSELIGSSKHSTPRIQCTRLSTPVRSIRSDRTRHSSRRRRSASGLFTGRNSVATSGA
jgi:hypothetical protein